MFSVTRFIKETLLTCCSLKKRQSLKQRPRTHDKDPKTGLKNPGPKKSELKEPRPQKPGPQKMRTPKTGTSTTGNPKTRTLKK